MKYDVEELFLCKCGDPSHSMIICYDHDERFDYKEVYMAVHLYREDSFFRRIWIALKYIFSKRRSIYGDFDEIILRPEDADKLQKVVDYLKTTTP